MWCESISQSWAGRLRAVKQITNASQTGLFQSDSGRDNRIDCVIAKMCQLLLCA